MPAGLCRTLFLTRSASRNFVPELMKITGVVFGIFNRLWQTALSISTSDIQGAQLRSLYLFL